MNETTYYHNVAIEDAFWERMRTRALYQPDISRSCIDRLSREMRWIFNCGQGTLFALVAELVDHSLSLGYPLSFRGEVGNLALAYAMGLAQNDPEYMGIPPFLQLTGEQVEPPFITLNAAYDVYPKLLEYLGNRVQDCQVQAVRRPPELWVFLIPKGEDYDSRRHYLTLDIRCDVLMDSVGVKTRFARRIPSRDEVFGPNFLRWTWQKALEDILFLKDLRRIRDVAPSLEPSSLDEYIAALTLALFGEKERLESLGDDPTRLFDLAATANQIYPRCQLAEYLTYALTLAWLQRYG